MGTALGGGVGVGTLAPMAGHEGLIEFYLALGTVESVLIHFVATLLLGTMVLGMMPLYGTESLKRAREAPVTSTLIGIPLAAILAMFLYGGFVLTEEGIGFVVGIPMVLVGVLFLPAWTALGFVSIGRSIAKRAGSDSLWLAVIIGGLVSALLPLSMPLVIAGVSLASAIGVGAGSRALFQMATGGLAEERVKPPSSQV